MSLGLNDLSKKRSPAKSKKEKASFPAGAWSARSTTARPWSTTGLTKQNHRKSPVDTEASMDEDWLHLHAEPLIWIEPAHESTLIRIQERLSQIENLVEKNILAPLSAFRHFCLPRKA